MTDDARHDTATFRAPDGMEFESAAGMWTGFPIWIRVLILPFYLAWFAQACVRGKPVFVMHGDPPSEMCCPECDEFSTIHDRVFPASRQCRECGHRAWFHK